MTWEWLKGKWNWLRGTKYFWYLVVAVVCLAAGFYVGFRQTSTTKVEYRNVEDAETMVKLHEALIIQQKLQEQLNTAEKKISELRVRKTETTRVTTNPDGSKVMDKTKVTEIDNKTDTTKTSTDSKTTDTNAKDTTVADSGTKTHTDTKQITITQPKDDYMVGISGGVGIGGVGAPGLEFKYRLFDFGKASLWTGAEVITGPPFNVKESQFRIEASVSF
jgi:hypothetical protein